MYTVQLTIKGMGPLQQSKEYASIHPKGIGDDGKECNETHDAYEKRTWKYRSHFNDGGFVIHPAGAFHQALIGAAQYQGDKIPGQGSKTWTQKVAAGVGVYDDLVTDSTEKDITCRQVFASAQGGKSKGEGRVWKYFPTLEKWTGKISVTVFDEIVSPNILRKIVEDAGKFIGIGTWRPGMGKGGQYGRFQIVDFKVLS